MGGLSVCSAIDDAGQIRTSSVAVVAVDGPDDLSLVGWRPREADGIEVVGVSTAAYAETAGGAGLDGYPPSGPPPSDVALTELGDEPVLLRGNSSLDPASPPLETGRTVLVGVRLAIGRDEGRLAGLDVDYSDPSGQLRTLAIDTELILTRGACAG